MTALQAAVRYNEYLEAEILKLMKQKGSFFLIKCQRGNTTDYKPCRVLKIRTKKAQVVINEKSHWVDKKRLVRAVEL